MFNTRIGDDLAVAQEIAKMAVDQVRQPGQSSSGNASGVRVSSNAIPPGEKTEGVAPDGTRYRVFLLGVDRMNAPEVHLG